ncbi:protein kinase [Microbacterium sp. NPDC096154]|uniref:serine/threonine-protein kinase n=1 Tax=Microbacterium sp. NPDC096154 TaxID=3155549 RepID=UPI0033345F72
MTSASVCEAVPGAVRSRARVDGGASDAELLGGRYRLEELVGRGGMGRVYRATDELLGRTVAIKLFPAAPRDDADLARRASETRLLAALSHPSLVTLFDADTAEDGSGYLVMEYVDGGTLADRIARGPLAPQQVAAVAADLAEALHAVHAAGIIHRDIKPPNVLMRASAQGPYRATLADFGIAYLVDGARMTTPGMAVGTAAYFSPEQARGAEPSPASDIYAFGLVLIEALTGRRAFPQTTPIEAAIARLHTPPQVPAGFGYGWRSLLTAMTATDPAARPTALEVASRARSLQNEADETAAAVPVATAATPVAVAETPTVAVASVDDPTHVVPVAPVPAAPAPATPRLRERHRRARRPRSMVGVHLAAGLGVTAIALGVWSGAAGGLGSAAFGSGATIGGHEVEVRGEIARVGAAVGEEPAEPDAPAEPVAVEPMAVEPAVVEPAVVQPDAAEPAAVKPAPATVPSENQNQGAGAPAERGEKAPAAERSADKTHGNGNGKGRSGLGKPDTGRDGR